MLALSALVAVLIVLIALIVVALVIAYVLRKRRAGHVLLTKGRPSGGSRRASR